MPTGKIFKVSYVYSSMFPFHFIQSVNTEFLLKKTYLVLTDQASVRYCKNECFFEVLPMIYNQNKKLKQMLTIFETLINKNSI